MLSTICDQIKRYVLDVIFIPFLTNSRNSGVNIHSRLKVVVAPVSNFFAVLFQLNLTNLVQLSQGEPVQRHRHRRRQAGGLLPGGGSVPVLRPRPHQRRHGPQRVRGRGSDPPSLGLRGRDHQSLPGTKIQCQVDVSCGD